MMSILLVEDDTIVRKSIERALKYKGYEVAEASSGKEAIRLAEDKVFDVVLSDIRMPEMDGLETVKRIGNHAKNILLMTGFVDPKRKLDYPCLMKPFGFEELMRYIEGNS